MITDCFKVSTVLLAKGHNPTILHPSFLKHEGIVPEDWVQSKDPICTPPFATVSFASGFTFLVEQQKFQVSFDGGNACQQIKQLEEMARKYAEKLPHVRYTAIGINFHAFCYPVEKPVEFINRRFIKKGPWDSEKYPLSSTRQNFTYYFADHQLNITIEPGLNRVIEKQGQQNGIFFNANYHTNCPPERPLEFLKTVLQETENRKEHFKHTANLFLEGEQ